jgi:DNA-binding XRE family transcriptional regulator
VELAENLGTTWQTVVDLQFNYCELSLILAPKMAHIFGAIVVDFYALKGWTRKYTALTYPY